MIEEIKNFEEIENTDMVENDEEPETSGKGIVGKLAIGALVVGGAAALIYKNKHKLEERKIRKLEKKGYIVVRPEDPMPEELCSDENEDEE